jgi:hypothetical protein
MAMEQQFLAVFAARKLFIPVRYASNLDRQLYQKTILTSIFGFPSKS